MAFDPFTAAFSLGEKLVDKFFSSPAEKQAALLKLRELEQSGELEHMRADVQMAMGQVEVNKIEAAGGWFRAGWRPSVGWVCAAAFGWTYVVQPFILSVVQIAAYVTGAEELFPYEMLPTLDIGALMPLLFGMLGLGTMRTYEKYKGKD